MSSASTRGLCSSRSNAQARPVAVVSWPATSSVTSSSRSSRSDIGRPAPSWVGPRPPLLVAGEREHREHVVALLEVGRRAPAGDLLEQHLVELGAALLE